MPEESKWINLTPDPDNLYQFGERILRNTVAHLEHSRELAVTEPAADLLLGLHIMWHCVYNGTEVDLERLARFSEELGQTMNRVCDRRDFLKDRRDEEDEENGME